jgi:hypothetical protein
MLKRSAADQLGTEVVMLQHNWFSLAATLGK